MSNHFDPFERGRFAYDASLPITANPFDPNKPPGFFRLWREGWESACHAHIKQIADEEDHPSKARDESGATE